MTDAVTKQKLFLLFLTVLGATFGVLLLIVPAQLRYFFLGACVFSGLGLSCFAKPVLLLYFIIFASAAGSLVQDLGKLETGSAEITVSGVQWMFVAGICALFIGCNLRRLRVPPYLRPFLLFVAWTFIRWATSAFSLVGMKDVLFYSLPLLVSLYALSNFSGAQRLNVEKIGTALLASVIIPVLVLVLLMSTGQIDLEARGPAGLAHPRPVALHLLVILSFSVAQWRYGGNMKARRRGVLLSLLSTGTILFTLSRMASLTALLILATSTLNPQKLWKLLPLASVGIVLFGLVLFHVPWFRQRSFFRAETGVSDSLQDLNTAGRADYFWPMTIEHALQKPIWGWGVGSARTFLGRAGPKIKDKWEPADYHPHDEYLQVFHDMGAPGLLFMLLAWGMLLNQCWKDWKQADLSGNSNIAKWSMAATVNLAAILFTIITDNTLHFAFVMTPVSIIVACAELMNRPHWRLSQTWEKQTKKDRPHASLAPVRYRFSPTPLITL